MSVEKLRSRRAWAVTPAAMSNLRRGATLLAKRSASKLAEPVVRRGMSRLRGLMALERACRLRQGDLLVELIDGHGLRPIDIARETGRRPNDLSQMYHTSLMFPADVRAPEVPYNHYLLATRMVRKFRADGLEPAEVLREIQSNGYTQHRDVTRHFAQRALAASTTRARLNRCPKIAVRAGNSSYCDRFQDIRDQFPAGSVKVLHIDPPYVYRNRAGGRYNSQSVSSLECDSADAGEAISLVIDLLRDWQPTLTPGGVLLMWQPSGLVLPEIVSAIDKYDWELESLVIWDKGRAQPGSFDSPYSKQFEQLLVLKRSGDDLLNHNNSTRGNILRFSPVSRPGAVDQQEHCFEKPAELCAFLIGKHSFENELVADLCGCTASMSVAAISLKRRWIYCESNPSNFRIGQRRIAECLKRLTSYG